MIHPAQFLRRNLPLLGVLSAGLLLGAIFFFALRSLEQRSAQASFDRVAGERLDSLEASVTLASNNLISLGAFYDVSRQIDRGEFARFTRILASRTNAIQAFEWIPKVPKRLRLAYEEAAPQDGLPSFQITERLPQGAFVSAADRDEYFPVFFVEPVRGNEKAIGLDLASDATRREALQRSRETGRLVATTRVVLVQERGDQFGFLVFVLCTGKAARTRRWRTGAGH